VKRPVTFSTLALVGVWLAILASPVQAAWAGKNGRIAFCDFSGGDCVITTMNADGSGRQALHGGFNPNWSPDGSRIVFQDGTQQGDQLFTMNPDGSAVQQVTHDGDNEDPSWSPDGSLLVYVHYPVGHCCPNIFTIRADGSGLRQVSSFGTDFGVREPEFSPDGQRIAFWQVGVRVGVDLSAVFIMRPDGSDIRQVTPLELDADHPEWSPDGSRLIFNNDAHQGVGDIFTIRPDGSGLKRLTNVIPLGLADFRPAYSPDGSMIVFNQGTSTTTLVMTMKANGGNPVVLSADGFGPDWGVLARGTGGRHGARAPWRPIRDDADAKSLRIQRRRRRERRTETHRDWSGRTAGTNRGIGATSRSTLRARQDNTTLVGGGLAKQHRVATVERPISRSLTTPAEVAWFA
jgi:dipeptidyl aminopeptidase/acylaminoacyl peptidase